MAYRKILQSLSSSVSSIRVVGSRCGPLGARNFRSSATSSRGNEPNLFYDKYKDKLHKVLGDESLPTQKEKRSTPDNPPRQEFPYSYTAAPSLDSVMRVDMIIDKTKEDIATLWEEYHKTKDCVGSVMPTHKYVQMYTKATHCPLFVYPLLRGDGVEMLFAQFSGHRCYFTSLINYQLHAENAPVCLTLTHYTDLQEVKGIVLMVGEVDTKSLTVLEAQYLANQVQLYYGSTDTERYNLVRTFNHEPENFDYQILLDHLNNSTINVDTVKHESLSATSSIDDHFQHHGHKPEAETWFYCERSMEAMEMASTFDYWEMSPISQRTWSIQWSLSMSRAKSLREIVSVDQLDVAEALERITTVKKIAITEQQQFTNSVHPCVLRIRSVKSLLYQVETIRKQSYSQDNTDHEQILMELWSLLQPSIKLEQRMSKQWQDIGFQGNNPATDFRGMGLLGLTCLHYFSSQYSDRARSLLSHSHHPQFGYPYAIVCINLTSLAYTLLKDGALNKYLYTVCNEWPLDKKEFMEIVSYLFVSFDSFWMESEPENVMVFPAVRKEFAAQLKNDLDNETVNMKLT